jgi:cytochrome c biogenesis protein CcmG/thiol:disulfide interchange protein DsbE
MNDATATLENRGKTGRIITAAATLSLLLVLAYGVLSQRPLQERPAPNFTLSLFDGGELSLRELRGQVVVVNFWASWCLPCREEAPALERVWREYQDNGVVFVGVNVSDVTNKALAFIDEFDISYPNGPDPYNRVSRAYGRTGVPETFIISRYGLVTERYIGAITEAQLEIAHSGRIYCCPSPSHCS